MIDTTSARQNLGVKLLNRKNLPPKVEELIHDGFIGDLPGHGVLLVGLSGLLEVPGAGRQDAGLRHVHHGLSLGVQAADVVLVHDLEEAAQRGRDPWPPRWETPKIAMSMVI